MEHISKKEKVLLFCQKIFNAQNILIVTHTNPDGDAIGSVTAISRFLENANRVHTVWTPNKYPDYLSFMDTDLQIKTFDENSSVLSEEVEKSDIIICMDFNQLKRIDNLEPYIKDSNAFKILIDHHPNPEEESFDLVFSDTVVSSTSECLYWILKSIVDTSPEYSEYFDGTVAESLYAGIMTDTNNFANSVSSNTFIAAAYLIDKGVDKEKIQHRIFGVFSENRMRLLGHALLNKMKVLPNLEAAYIVLTKEELVSFNFKEGDIEGFVNLPLNINNINISALFTETQEYIRVSLRSTNDFSVNKLSRVYFNGAGHERAAGGRLYLPVEEVGRFFEEKLKLYIDDNSRSNL